MAAYVVVNTTNSGPNYTTSRDVTHVVETRLPTGHVVTSTAPAQPPPSRHHARRVETYLTDLIIEWAA